MAQEFASLGIVEVDGQEIDLTKLDVRVTTVASGENHQPQRTRERLCERHYRICVVTHCCSAR